MRRVQEGDVSIFDRYENNFIYPVVPDYVSPPESTGDILHPKPIQSVYYSGAWFVALSSGDSFSANYSDLQGEIGATEEVVSKAIVSVGVASQPADEAMGSGTGQEREAPGSSDVEEVPPPVKPSKRKRGVADPSPKKKKKKEKGSLSRAILQAEKEKEKLGKFILLMFS